MSSPISRAVPPPVEWSFWGAGATPSVQAHASDLVELFDEFLQLLGEPVILTVGRSWDEWSASRWSKALRRLERGELDALDIAWIPNQREVPYPGVTSAWFGVWGLRTEDVSVLTLPALVQDPQLPGYPTVDLDAVLAFVRRVVTSCGLLGGSLAVRGVPGIDFGWSTDGGWGFGLTSWAQYIKWLGWGVLLTEGHLEKLGGIDHVSATAPVENLIRTGNGLWLELTDWPLNVDQTEIDSLRDFLTPVIPTIKQVQEANNRLDGIET